MYASKVTRQALLDAALAIGVRAEIDRLNDAGTRHKVKLYPLVPQEALTASGRRRKGDKGNAKYQRISVSPFQNGRRVHAVCWHGFRDYFRAVFKSAPNAVFRTSLDTWRGSADFEARYRASGDRNVGPPIAPITFAQACKCPESGNAY